MAFVVLLPGKHPPSRNNNLYCNQNNNIYYRNHPHRLGRRQRLVPTTTTAATTIVCALAASSTTMSFSFPFSSALTMTPPSMNRNQTTSSSTSNNSIFSASSSPFSVLFNRSGSLLPISSRHLIFHHFTTENPVTSTQDEARRLLSHHVATHGTNKAMAVLADIQLHGRGTQGRKWERGQQRRRQQQEEEEAEMTASSTTKTNPMMTSDGNMYLTVCIPFDRVPVFITLLPLQIGVLVAERLNHIVHACSNNSNSERQQSQLPAAVTVKWPNDVLIREQKISGTLIENAWIEMDGSTTTTAAASSSWLLIGVGINVASAPYDLSNSPGKQTRSAVCLQDVCNDQDDPIRLPDSTAWILGQDIASALADWVYVEEDEGVKDSTMMTTNTQKLERGRKVIQNWLQYAEFQKTYELRGRVVDEEQGGYQGERVITLGIQGDGQLRVKGADGRERLLVADYLF